MPFKKLKEEHYKNLGGMNSRVSPYIEGPQEFLDMVNFDFQTPGSLTQRWGSTTYTSGASFFGQMHSLVEFARLDGSSSIVGSHTGALWSINASLAVGVSSANMGSTYGHSFVLYAPAVNMYSGDGTAGAFLFSDSQTTKKLYYNPVAHGSSPYDFAVFNNKLYMANGAAFYKMEGTTLTPAFLGYPLWAGAGVSVQSSSSFSPTTGFYPFGASLRYSIGCFFTDYDGNRGPIAYLTELVTGNSTRAYRLYGQLGSSIPYGVSNITFCSTVGYTLGSPFSYLTNFYVLDSSWVMTPDAFAGGSLVDLGSLGGSLMPASGATLYASFGFLPDFPGVTTGNYLPMTVSPKHIEVFANRLFMSGFAYNKSAVWWSAVGALAGMDPTSYIEVRTNDGDEITCLKNYGPRLVIFKNFSFHVLAGDAPQNFSVGQASDEYGCVNNRCAVVYNDLMAFLDYKGVISFNGASSELISYKIQNQIDRINWSAAKTTACMINDKQRSQLLIAVPVDGATYNNLTLVYDYIVNAWTKYEGFNPAVFAVMSGRLSTRTAFIGGYSGTITHFGSSFQGDAGAGFTCYAKPAFMHPGGQATEKQFRRLFLNVDEVTSATVPININFFKNYGSSTVLNRTMYLSPFQSRIDFGIPSKSLTFEFSKFSATTTIKVHGFALGYRFQRDV